jgi:hypothetical protein
MAGAVTRVGGEPAGCRSARSAPQSPGAGNGGLSVRRLRTAVGWLVRRRRGQAGRHVSRRAGQSSLPERAKTVPIDNAEHQGGRSRQKRNGPDTSTTWSDAWSPRWSRLRSPLRRQCRQARRASERSHLGNNNNAFLGILSFGGRVPAASELRRTVEPIAQIASGQAPRRRSGRNSLCCFGQRLRFIQESFPSRPFCV